MPRRNLRILLLVTIVCLVCQRRFSFYGGTFVTAMDEIHAHYLEPVDRSVLLRAALRGMTSRLDPYSEFVAPHEYTQLQESLEQHFGGVGIQLSLDPETKQLTVVSPLVGTPAYRAGVLAGDKIVEIDGKSTHDFVIEDAAKLLRGKPGTGVDLTVVHVGQEEPVTLHIERAVIEIESVLGDTRLPDGSWNFLLPAHPEIAYIRIVQFSEHTTDELRTALAAATQAGAKAAILDLRNDPGGLLDQAVSVSGLFIKEGVIVSTRGRGGVQNDVYRADGSAPYANLPLVVLVNQFSASASEVVAAALQDHERTTIIGQRTYGKGSVQQVFPLEGGQSGLKLTTYSYWRPSGKNIHRLKEASDDQEWGVSPNEGFEVKLDDEQLKTWFKFRRDRDIVHPGDAPPDTAAELFEVDPQLHRAVEHLESVLKPST